MLDTLLSHPDPIIRYKARVKILQDDPASPEIIALRQEIRTSPRIRKLFSDVTENGTIPFHPYAKWQGAHWVLTVLADTGYPPGDPVLVPLRDQVYSWILSPEFIAGIHHRTAKNRQIRLHGSMEGNALFSSLALDLADECTPQLVDRLLWAQWDDGGWNCDRHSHADTSSFYETLTPMRALGLYARLTGDPKAFSAVQRASEVFLSRRLFRRRSDGTVMRAEFLKPRYPAYFFYDILHVLKVMAETGFIHDPRCQEALDLLESKRSADGWFAAEGRHYEEYRVPAKELHRGSRTGWGAYRAGTPNEFITVDALYVLHAAGRYS
jgi:hypothetical protein